MLPVDHWDGCDAYSIPGAPVEQKKPGRKAGFGEAKKYQLRMDGALRGKPLLM